MLQIALLFPLVAITFAADTYAPPPPAYKPAPAYNPAPAYKPVYGKKPLYDEPPITI